MTTKAEILADHYQKTFELTLMTWEKRNLTFLILLAVVGVATLLTFNVAEAQPLLVDFVMKLFDIKEATRASELRSSFPYGLLQSILLMVIMYLTLLLYHRTATIQRFYEYMAGVEKEIRADLQLDASATSFTREGSFYETHRPVLGRFVGLSYVSMLGLLLLAFLGYRVFSDFSNEHVVFGIIDTLLSIPTLVFYVGYVRSS